ncbi:hypothetical protein KFE25_013661 [Diacronema lutheri]|uniref:Uncharacterized protein n=2 Tax=Diacronema lutheri TaxID=2081491 RepID=A0A8J6CI97_DIALT|nr:hypothetical protein KFE25_013661 [Diacronema lutheri]
MAFKSTTPGMNWNSPIFEGNQVAVQLIWAKHVSKEQAVVARGRKTTFSANPGPSVAMNNGMGRQLQTVTGKVGTVFDMDVPIEDVPEDVKETINAMLRTNRLPSEKYDEPMTAAQEVGWHASEHAKYHKSRFQHHLSLSAEAKFAEAYALKHPGEFLYSGQATGKFFKM